MGIMSMEPMQFDDGTFDFKGERLTGDQIKEKLDKEYTLVDSRFTVENRMGMMRGERTYERDTSSMSGSRINETVELNTIGNKTPGDEIVSFTISMRLMDEMRLRDDMGIDSNSAFYKKEAAMGTSPPSGVPLLSAMAMKISLEDDLLTDRQRVRKDMVDAFTVPPSMIGEARSEQLSPTVRENLRNAWEEQFKGDGGVDKISGYKESTKENESTDNKELSGNIIKGKRKLQL